MKKALVLFIFIFGLNLLMGCIYPKQVKIQSPSASQSGAPHTELTPPPVLPDEPMKLSAWATYWDMQNVMDEARGLGDSLGSLSFFAAYFDAEGKLFVREEIPILFEESKSSLKDITRYITVVNDKLNLEGAASLKDVDLLYSLFESDNAINTHMEDLITLAKDGGYDGIEIDYEGIRNDFTLWNRFLMFVQRLSLRADEAGLNLRVLLEPSTPFEQLEFPAGPEYVMMCYNLYGSHTEPGPKADAEFIRKLAEKMSKLPGEKTFAIATGGFDWERSNDVISITEEQAVALQDKYSPELYRDEASACVVFQYTDEENDHHEVWYADGVTLRYWMDVIKEYGNTSVAIWRLGGNISLNSLLGE